VILLFMSKVRRIFMKSAILAACLAAIPVFGHSATVALYKGAVWTEFRFDESFSEGAWVEPNDGLGILTFTIFLTKAATLQVTDAFLAGDRFEVFSNKVSLGLTSNPTSTGDDTDADYDLALSDDRWSSGNWTLAAGNHRITGFVQDMPLLRGRGALRVVDIPAVPLSGSMPLMLGAGAALGALSLRRRKPAVTGAAK
jgi:hypothetical protein